MEVESNASVTTYTKVVVHRDDLCTPLQSEVATMLNLNLPPGEGERERVLGGGGGRREGEEREFFYV